MKSHPLARVLRPDKLTLQALEATLDICRCPEEAMERIPTLRMLAAGEETLRDRASDLVRRLRELQPDWEIRLRKTEDEAGGGSLPNVSLPGYAAAIVPKGRSVDALEEALRLSETCIVSRIHEGELLLSARTLLPGDEERIAVAVAAL